MRESVRNSVTERSLSADLGGGSSGSTGAGSIASLLHARSAGMTIVGTGRRGSFDGLRATTAVPKTKNSIVSPYSFAALPPRATARRGAAPGVLLLLDLDADDARRADVLGLGLQALHRELARVVEAVRVGRLSSPLRASFGDDERLGPHVVDGSCPSRSPRGDSPSAAASRSPAPTRPDWNGLPLRVAEASPPAWRTAVPTAMNSATFCPHAWRFTSMRTPMIAVGPELVGLLLHAGHRELARVVERLRHLDELAAGLVLAEVLRRARVDVVDAAAHHEAERLEARLLHEQELVDREIAREKVRLPHPLRDARARAAADRRGAGGRGRWGRSFVVLVGFLGRFRLGLARLLLEPLGLVVALDDLACACARAAPSTG